MNKPVSTKEKLLHTAKDLFWTRGYSNVSVRDITGAAGVDAALVSRYFGGKHGLFEATLTLMPSWDALSAERGELLEKVVESFSQPFDPKRDFANPFTMLLANIIDPEMGDKIRDLVTHEMAEPLAEIIGGDRAEEQAAMLLAVLFGGALMRKNFQLAGIADQPTEVVSAQMAHLVQAVLNFES